MPDAETKKAISTIREEMADLNNLYSEMKGMFSEPKESEKIEERRFQLRLLTIQQGTVIVASVIAIIASLFVAIFASQLTLINNLSNETSISVQTLLPLLATEIVTALLSIVGSWFIVIALRNRKIKQIEDEFYLNLKKAQTNPEKEKTSNGKRAN